MSFKIYSELESIKTETLLAVIYGVPGIGKTSLAFTARNPLHLDFDKGVQRAVKRKLTVRVEKWQDVIDLQNSKEFKELAPETLILDTGATMLDNYIAAYVKEDDPKNSRKGGELSLAGYGAMKNVFKQFKDWTRLQKCNVIFICHAKDDRDGDNIRRIPLITGGSLDILRQESDLIGYMSSIKNKRKINFSPDIDEHEGKDCAELGLVDVPHYEEPEYDDFFQSIIDRTLERMNEISNHQKEVMEKVAVYEKEIEKTKTPAAANKIVKKLMDDEVFVQRKCFKTLRAHCRDNKVATYDKEKKTFVKYESTES